MNIFNIGPMELLMILVIVLIVFGPNKIPEIGASIGKMVRQSVSYTHLTLPTIYSV